MVLRKSRAIPKAETGIYDLFDKYPGSDGRGVKIAVLDTGCDLNAAGLNGTTSDGVTPKYIDFLDCTGDGDISMTKTIEIEYPKNETIEGLSGRNLTLGEWANGITSLKLGAVRLFELLPRGVERRIKKERKEAFLIKHRALISKTQLDLDSLSSTDKDKDSKEDGDDGDSSKPSPVEKEKKELKLLLEQLNAIEEAYEDFGPLMDVVMFEDEGTWKALIDLEAKGDLSTSVPMAPFGNARQIGELGFGTAVTFCIQVYDNGNTLSIVTDAGSHGTHVAGIAAANFGGDDSEGKEDQDDLNGVAPGAQILACKIGDGRLGSTETGTGLIRALIAAKKYGCDLINLSYGEPSWRPDSGRVSDVFADAVHKWGMTVFTSAGNDGPALSTLGSPGSESAPITVGAFVSPEMMVEQYSTLPPEEGDSPLQGASYYFSSRGPTPDGMLPTLCAPGGAISPIPRHSLQGKAQYHGTSMSSPNACGVAACILSAVRSQNKDCGPNEFKRALVNSAKAPSGIVEPFSQGAGLISALDCADYIISNHGKGGQNIAIDASIPARNGARGLYIRDEIELDGPMAFGVQVNPRFSHALQRTTSEMDELLSLELNLKLKASESWVTCPDSMTLLSATERNGQTFAVRLNAKDLQPGVHFATVDAFDASDSSRGSLFSLPITVVIPHTRFVSQQAPLLKLNDKEHFELKENGLDFSTTVQLEQGIPNRRFITVPAGAEWATIKLKGTESLGISPRFMLHAVPFVRGDLPNTESQLKKIYQMKDGVEEEYHLSVKGGSCLEVCLQLLWLANPLPASITANIEFHSFNARSQTLVSSQPITISAASEFARLGASTPLRAEKLNPSAKLKSINRTLRPKQFDITLGDERDDTPPSDAEVRASKNGNASLSKIYEMRLQYEFSIEGDKAIPVRPSVPSLFHQLYDSPVDSQLWSLEDSNAQILTFGGPMHHVEAVSLKKGNYTIKALIRHPNRSVLEQIKDLPFEISLNLSDALSCEVYSQIDKASTPAVKDERSSLQSKLLSKGSHQDIYVARPKDDLPSWAASGDVARGTLTLDKDKESVTTMELQYAIPPKPNTKDAKKDPEKKDEDSLEDIVFKAKLSYIAGLRAKNSTVHEEIAAVLLKEQPSSVPLYSELLSFALERPLPSDATNEDMWRSEKVQDVFNMMQKAKNGPIDQASLAQYFGLNEPSKEDLEDDKEAKKLNKEMNEQRDFLKKILLTKASLVGKNAGKDSLQVDGFDLAVKELKQWVSMEKLKDDKDKTQLSITLAKHAMVCQNKKATALSILLKAKKDLSGKELKQVDEELAKLYGEYEGMDHVVENLKEGIHSRYPVIKRGV